MRGKIPNIVHDAFPNNSGGFVARYEVEQPVGATHDNRVARQTHHTENWCGDDIWGRFVGVEVRIVLRV